MHRCSDCGEGFRGLICPLCGLQFRKRSRPRVTLVGILTMLGLLAMLVAILLPNFIRYHCGGPSTACKSNLKNTATALEMYSTDNQGLYPRSLGQLTPNYLKIIPNCPTAQRDTYSESYRVATGPDAFTLYCSGFNHSAANTPVNYPQYSSFEGLIER